MMMATLTAEERFIKSVYDMRVMSWRTMMAMRTLIEFLLTCEQEVTIDIVRRKP